MPCIEVLREDDVLADGVLAGLVRGARQHARGAPIEVSKAELIMVFRRPILISIEGFLSRTSKGEM